MQWVVLDNSTMHLVTLDSCKTCWSWRVQLIWGLYNKPDTKKVQGFVDADWGSCPDNRRSYIGSTLSLSSLPIPLEIRESKNHCFIANRSGVHGYEAATETIYLSRFLVELGFGILIDILVFNDNMSAKKLTENPTIHARNKQIGINSFEKLCKINVWKLNTCRLLKCLQMFWQRDCQLLGLEHVTWTQMFHKKEVLEILYFITMCLCQQVVLRFK